MLAELGIDRAFSRDAEFELMSENPEGLFLGEVLHKAFLQINEFLLRDRATGLIHFSAAVRLPETEPVF